MDEYFEAIAALPPWLAAPAAQVDAALAAQIHELRLRTGCAPAFTVRGVRRAAAELPAGAALQGLRFDGAMLEECLYALCGGALHSHEDELACGFLTLPGGHRVGVGGRYGKGEDGRTVLQRVDSLNLRIARSRLLTLPPFVQQRMAGRFTGVLIAGEPDSGKTTLLRSLLPLLEKAGRTAAVIDEREEILPAGLLKNGRFAGCDRISGLPKSKAVEMALRTLSPGVIVLDELGALRETELLEQGFFSGVDFIATVHAASAEEAESRPQVRFLRDRGMLRCLWQLRGRTHPGEIGEEKVYC